MTRALGRLAELGLFLAAVTGITVIASRTLGTALADVAHQAGEYTLRVDHRGGPQSSRDSTLRVKRIVADGRAIRLDQVEGSDTWQGFTAVNSGVPDELRFPSGAESRSLTFRARTFALVANSWEWPGTLTILRDGRELRSIDLAMLRGTYAKDDSGKGSMLIPTLLGLLIAGIVTWRFRPRPSRPLGRAWLTAVLVTVHLIYWITQGIGTTNDSLGYLASAEQLFLGFPSYFPPGYPLFLGIIGAVAGPLTGAIASLLQHGMVVIAALWMAALLERVADRRSALLGGLLAGALPTMLAMPQAILTEAPTLFAMVGALHFAVRAVESDSVRLARVAGLFLAWAVLLRVVPVVPLLPALGALYLVPWQERRLRLLRATATTGLLLVLAQVLWFTVHEDRVTLVTSVGHHLYNRVISAQDLIDTTGPAAGRLISSLDGRNPGTDAWWEVKSAGGLEGITDTRAQDALLGSVAVEGLRSNFWEYVAYVPQIAWWELIASQEGWIPGWGESSEAVDPRLESPRLISPTAEGLRWRWGAEHLQGETWPYLIGVAIAGFVLGLRSSRPQLVLALAAMPAGYLLCSAALDHFAARHVVPVTPFIVALAAIAVGRAPDLVRALHPARASTHLATWRSEASRLIHRAALLSPDGDS